MENLKTDSPVCCGRIILSILDFLDSVKTTSATDIESLKVAKERLSEAFKIDLSSTSGVPISESLVHIFSSQTGEDPEINSDIIEELVTYVYRNVQFDGFLDDDPYTHLASFNQICNLYGVRDDASRLRIFPFSLRDRAKSWFRSLPEGYITTWDALADKFLRNYFPPSRTPKLCRDITSFQQMIGESFYEAWERFKGLLRKCPNHGFDTLQQVRMFYFGVSGKARKRMDANAGGFIHSKTAKDAYELIEWIAMNTPWQERQGSANQVDAMVALTTQLTELTQKVDQMQMHMSGRQMQSGCELCGGPHVSGYCQSYNENLNNHPKPSYRTELERLVSNFHTASELRN